MNLFGARCFILSHGGECNFAAERRSRPGKGTLEVAQMMGGIGSMCAAPWRVILHKRFKGEKGELGTQ